MIQHNHNFFSFFSYISLVVLVAVVLVYPSILFNDNNPSFKPDFLMNYLDK